MVCPISHLFFSLNYFSRLLLRKTYLFFAILPTVSVHDFQISLSSTLYLGLVTANDGGSRWLVNAERADNGPGLTMSQTSNGADNGPRLTMSQT
jgi:hypothetical protein